MDSSSTATFAPAPTPAAETEAQPTAVVRAVPPHLRPMDPKAQMRIYAAILGHEPTVDPNAPDLLPRAELVPTKTPTLRETRDVESLMRYGAHVATTVRAHATPSWRQLVDQATHATAAAARRLRDARSRVDPSHRPYHRDAA